MAPSQAQTNRQASPGRSRWGRQKSYTAVACPFHISYLLFHVALLEHIHGVPQCVLKGCTNSSLSFAVGRLLAPPSSAVFLVFPLPPSQPLPPLPAVLVFCAISCFPRLLHSPFFFSASFCLLFPARSSSSGFICSGSILPACAGQLFLSLVYPCWPTPEVLPSSKFSHFSHCSPFPPRFPLAGNQPPGARHPVSRLRSPHAHPLRGASPPSIRPLLSKESPISHPTISRSPSSGRY